MVDNSYRVSCGKFHVNELPYFQFGHESIATLFVEISNFSVKLEQFLNVHLFIDYINLLHYILGSIHSYNEYL